MDVDDSYFDNDILKAIQNIYLINENYTKCMDKKEELENMVLTLQRLINEIRESEKQQIEANASAKEIIAEQLFTISKLVTTLDEMKIYKEESSIRNEKIEDLQREIARLSFNHAEEKLATQNYHILKIEEIKNEYEQKAQKLKDDTDGIISEMVCNESELKETISRIKEIHEEQTNVMVLGYEEKLQRSYAQTGRMRDEIQAYKNKTDANISVYQKRIEELEQRRLPRTNIVAPNNVRCGPSSFVPASDLLHSDSVQPRHTTTVFNSKKGDLVAPPFKLSSKHNTPYQRQFKPLQVQITSANSSNMQGNQKSLSPVKDASVIKPAKRKLFTKHDDEFCDLEFDINVIESNKM